MQRIPAYSPNRQVPRIGWPTEFLGGRVLQRGSRYTSGGPLVVRTYFLAYVLVKVGPSDALSLAIAIMFRNVATFRTTAR